MTTPRRQDIADAADRSWDVVGRELVAPYPHKRPGPIYCPKLNPELAAGWSSAPVGGTYSLPIKVLDGVPSPHSPMFVATSFFWWCYMTLGGGFHHVPAEQVWSTVLGYANRRPEHGATGHGTYECCLWCRHDITMRWLARFFAAMSVGGRLQHFSLETHETITAKALLSKSTKTLDAYVENRLKHRHRDHPVAALLTPSKSRGPDAVRSRYYHVHIVAEAPAPLAVKPFRAIAEANGLRAKGELVEPVGATLHDVARTLDYATRQVLAHDPLVVDWNQPRFRVWTAGNARR